ncbi:MAG: YgjV family protein [Rubrivivax sp.]|jgi:hypothetical protein
MTIGFGAGAFEWATPAQAMGALAFVFGVLCFAQRDERRFIVFMALECAAYALHFAWLGHPVAMASTLLSLARSLAALRWRRPATGLIFLAAHLAVGALLYSGPVSLLPVVSACLGTSALFFLRGLAMRGCMLVGTLLWVVHNVAVGSIGGTLLELVLAVTNAVTVWRLWREGREGRASRGEPER